MGGGACHEALQHDAHLSKADKGVEVTDTRGGSITCAAEHQALDPRHLRNGLHRDDGGSRSSFLPPRRVRAPPASSVLLPNLHCSSRTWLRRYDLLAAARGRQCTLGQEPAPREELVRGNAMAASYQAYRHARLERLLDDLDFLRRCPARRRLTEIAPELTGHGLPLGKCEAYNRVYDQFYQSR